MHLHQSGRMPVTSGRARSERDPSPVIMSRPGSFVDQIRRRRSDRIRGPDAGDQADRQPDAGDPFRPDHPGAMPAKGQRFPRLHTNFTYKIRPVVGSIKYIQCKAANERARHGRNDPPGSVDVKRSLTCPADVQRNPGSFDMSVGRGPARQRVA